MKCGVGDALTVSWCANFFVCRRSPGPPGNVVCVEPLAQAQDTHIPLVIFGTFSHTFSSLCFISYIYICSTIYSWESISIFVSVSTRPAERWWFKYEQQVSGLNKKWKWNKRNVASISLTFFLSLTPAAPIPGNFSFTRTGDSLAEKKTSDWREFLPEKEEFNPKRPGEMNWIGNAHQKGWMRSRGQGKNFLLYIFSGFFH